ncbi:putative ribonuclease H-like domain-containing protein [Tanacetum coccineum]
MTHPYPKRNFVPKAVLMKSGIKTLNTARQNFSKAAILVNTARPINTAYQRPTMNSARTSSNIRRPFNKSTTYKNSNLKEKVNTVKGNVTTTRPKAVVSDNKGNAANAIKASACWGNPHLELKEKGVINSGCSRHMTGNKSYLSNYEEIDGGFVAFGGDPKGGRITSKGKISTGKLDFEDVYFVKELKFNLFSVSQMRDKKNNVLFTDTECVVLSPDFKLLDENHVLLRVPRKDNMYNVDLKNIVPSRGKFDGKADEGFFVGYSTNSKAFKDSLDTGFKPSGEEEKMDSEHLENKDSEVPNTEEPRVHQEQDANVNSTNNINTLYPTVNAADIEINVVDKNIVYGCIDDISMPNLEEIVYSDDDEEVGAEADMNNLATTVPVSHIQTTGVHKDHPLKQIIRDIHSAPQTRRMTKNVIEHVEPKKVIQALIDPSWIEAMQDELLQFKLQKVWTLVDLPYGKRAIGTKQVYRNKKDDRVARIEAIRLFLAYASFMNFIVYQVDVKSAFLYGIIKEEFYVCQPPGFEDPEFPNKVYKVEKALYGLHQALRAWYETLSTYLLENGFRRGTIDKTLFIKKDTYDILLVHVYVDNIIFGSTKKSLCTEFEQIMYKRFQMSSMLELTFFLGLQVKQKGYGIFIIQDKYVADILKKFNFSTVKTTSTPMETNKALLKDEEAADVDVHLYRSMIRSLMYLTTSRPAIMFAICACARDSLFDLEVFSDSDYAGASLDRKSTTGAEYVVSTNCCGQVLWIQNQLLDYGYNFMNTKIYIDNESTICIVKNPVFHSKTKHIKIRHHFIRDSYEKRLIQVIKIHTDHNVAHLLTKAFDVSRFQYLIANETAIKEWEDRMERDATIASSLEAEQDSGNINRTHIEVAEA